MRPELSQYNHVSAGKVREIYEIDDDTLLMVVSDRISAYDHILDPEIPDKGLKTADGKPLRTFEVAGEDEVFHPAEASIEGDKER